MTRPLVATRAIVAGRAIAAPLLLLACALPPGSPPPEAELSSVVEFQGRRIDVEPHIAGWPYRSFRPFPELGQLLYMHEGETRELRRVPLAGGLELDAGTRVNDVDWNRRNLSGMDPLPGENALLFAGDEDNQEAWDLYRLELADGSIRRLTDVPYIYGWGVTPDKRRIGYLARYPLEGSETYRTCLELIPVDGGEARRVVCDEPERTFTWSPVRFSADARLAFVNANLAGDRSRRQLLRIRLADGHVEQISSDVPRSRLGMLERFLDEDATTFAAVNDESGFANLYAGGVEGGGLTPLTRFEVGLSHVTVLETPVGRRVLAVVERPWESELLVMDTTGRILEDRVLPSDLYLLQDTPEEIWFYSTSRAEKLDLIRVGLDENGRLRIRSVLKLPPELERQLVHCDVERVEIPTFDVDPATGERRLLHAFYSTPRVPPAAGERRLAGIVAFYGGSNSFDTGSQIFCQAGIATLSPAVRGSWGFGREFAALNDGDLGGDEIVDLQWIARWLVETHGYRPRDIGTYGGSHGGYATLRSLTFPPETNGRNSDFDFGWGISFYGFSDIETFWRSSNIPDWVLLEAGDPETEPEKIRARSPLHHVDRLDAPVLLLHGENDQRVPVAESRRFAEACTRAGRQCTYVEFEGQGHGLKGLRNQVRVYREIFAFLERLPGGE